jgi:hypothetical protein
MTMKQKTTPIDEAARSVEMGSQEAMSAFARNMLTHAEPLEKIIQVTGLTEDQILSLDRRQAQQPIQGPDRRQNPLSSFADMGLSISPTGSPST